MVERYACSNALPAFSLLYNVSVSVYAKTIKDSFGLSIIKSSTLSNNLSVLEQKYSTVKINNVRKNTALKRLTMS